MSVEEDYDPYMFSDDGVIVKPKRNLNGCPKMSRKDVKNAKHFSKLFEETSDFSTVTIRFLEDVRIAPLNSGLLNMKFEWGRKSKLHNMHRAVIDGFPGVESREVYVILSRSYHYGPSDPVKVVKIREKSKNLWIVEGLVQSVPKKKYRVSREEVEIEDIGDEDEVEIMVPEVVPRKDVLDVVIDHLIETYTEVVKEELRKYWNLKIRQEVVDKLTGDLDPQSERRNDLTEKIRKRMRDSTK